MCICPFLTTFQEEVECFEECPFYNYEGENKNCPFKQVYSEREKYSQMQHDLEDKYDSYFHDKKLLVV